MCTQPYTSASYPGPFARGWAKMAENQYGGEQMALVNIEILSDTRGAIRPKFQLNHLRKLNAVMLDFVGGQICVAWMTS